MTPSTPIDPTTTYRTASTATSSMLWHYVEHVPCTPRARAERAFGTHMRRADTLAPTVLARSAKPLHALPFSQLRAKQPRRARQAKR